MRYVTYTLIALSLSLLSGGLFASMSDTLNMPYGVSPVSQEIYNLHMAGFYVCCGIGVIVFGVLIYSLIKYRKSKGAKAAHFHEHLGVELIWTIIPLLILVALAIPATIVLAHIHDTEKSEMTIKVTGFQWKWKYDYLDQGVSFLSNLATTQEQINGTQAKTPWFLLEVDKPMVVPINTKIKLLLTANDVIHAWWVPELGVKQDAIPGYINENWIYVTKPGTYRGQCGELCGVNHGFMPIVVVAVTKEEFKQWVKANGPAKKIEPPKTFSEAELLKLGKAQYDKSCGMCHQANGKGLPPSFPPLKASRVVTGPTEAAIAFVMTGVPGTAMQAFGEQLDDQEVASVVTYIRQAWDNKVLTEKGKYPTIVQPTEIQKWRDNRKSN